jgi:hypothetical protein
MQGYVQAEKPKDNTIFKAFTSRIYGFLTSKLKNILKHKVSSIGSQNN